ncbi:phospholipase D-like domain-containing protein [Hyphomicrobium sp.]|uniref:phospholipase D-like domain-containing protein n=1 Tax=Hyphomicrobium sp. TaxID=82 RepID=UPI003F724AFA
MKIDLPEEALLDAVSFDTRGAALLLQQLATAQVSIVRAGLLDDMRGVANLSPQRFRDLLEALIGAGAISRSQDGVSLAISREDALRHAAVLRGASYAKYRHRDSNSVEITLSPPAHPSRLMERLPKGGFSWAGLYHTTDSLAELASQARRRFVIASPFIDKEGMDWVESLFDATAKHPIQRILIIRGRDAEDELLLRRHNASLYSRSVTVLRYDIEHDRAVRQLGYESFHAKIMLADDDKAYVGSSNMTRASRDYSMECGVVVRGPGAKPVAALVEAIIGICKPWV